MGAIKTDMRGARIENSNVLATDCVVAISVAHAPIDWSAIQDDMKQLRIVLADAPEYIRKTMTAFSNEAEAAAKESDWERFKAAAKKIGSIGLEYLRDLSIAVLAELVAKALL